MGQRVELAKFIVAIPGRTPGGKGVLKPAKENLYPQHRSNYD